MKWMRPGLTFWVLVAVLPAFADASPPAGEEELFARRRAEAEKEARRSSREVGFDFGVTSNSRFTRDLFSSTHHDYFDTGVALRGVLVMGRHAIASFKVPYLSRVGIVESENEFKVHYGLGDAHANLHYSVVGDPTKPVDLSLEAGVLVPAGQSQFDPSFEGYYPLGNGFWAVPTELGASVKPSPSALVFAYERPSRSCGKRG